MATAEQLRAEFEAYMDRKDVKYTVENERDNLIRISYGTSTGDVAIYVDFDELDDVADTVHFACPNVGTPAEGNGSKALLACNEWNKNHRWAKLYLEKDGDIWADFDATVFLGTVGEECFDCVQLLLKNVESFRAENKDILKSDDTDDQLRMLMELLKALGND